MKTGPKSPTKFTKPTVRKLEDAFSMGCNVVEACLHAGISRETYYKYIKKDKKLSDRLEQLKNEPILKARITVMNNLDNPKVAMWYLERKLPNEFSKNRPHEIQQESIQPILQIKVVKPKPLKEDINR